VDKIEKLKKTPIYYVINTEGIGGAEKRFSDLWYSGNEIGYEFHLVIDTKCYEKFCEIEEYKQKFLKYAHRLHNLNIYGSNYYTYIYNCWKYFSKVPKNSVIHFPLSYVFGLRLFFGLKTVSSYVACLNIYNFENIGKLKSNLFRIFGFYSANAIDVLDPLNYKKLSKRFFCKNKINQTKGITHFNTLLYKPKEKKNIYTFLGRFNEEKQILKFISILPELNAMLLRARVKNYTFYICGNGEQLDEILNSVGKDSFKNVKLKIFFAKDPPEILGKSNIFFSLQKTSNYPSRSLAEAIGCGCFPIVTNTGDTELMIKGIRSYHMVPKSFNAQNIFEGIMKYNNKTKKEKYLLKNELNKYAIKHYSINKQLNYYLKLYSNII